MAPSAKLKSDFPPASITVASGKLITFCQILLSAGSGLLSPISLYPLLKIPLMYVSDTKRIISLELWAIVLLLLFMWAAFGLNGFLITVLLVALLQSRARQGSRRMVKSFCVLGPKQ